MFCYWWETPEVAHREHGYIWKKQAAEQVMLQEVQKRARKADNVYIVNFLTEVFILTKTLF